MCYSDFPPPKEFPNFMHHTHVRETAGPRMHVPVWLGSCG